MTLTLYMLIIITTTFTLYLASTPIILGANILIISLLLSAVFASFIRSRFAFLVFLIYVGGILVMFAYFLALTPNQQISYSNNFKYSIISIVVFTTMTYSSNIKVPTIREFHQGKFNTLFNEYSPIPDSISPNPSSYYNYCSKTNNSFKGPTSTIYILCSNLFEPHILQLKSLMVI